MSDCDLALGQKHLRPQPLALGGGLHELADDGLMDSSSEHHALAPIGQHAALFPEQGGRFEQGDRLALEAVLVRSVRGIWFLDPVRPGLAELNLGQHQAVRSADLEGLVVDLKACPSLGWDEHEALAGWTTENESPANKLAPLQAPNQGLPKAFLQGGVLVEEVLRDAGLEPVRVGLSSSRRARRAGSEKWRKASCSGSHLSGLWVIGGNRR